MFTWVLPGSASPIIFWDSVSLWHCHVTLSHCHSDSVTLCNCHCDTVMSHHDTVTVWPCHSLCHINILPSLTDGSWIRWHGTVSYLAALGARGRRGRRRRSGTRASSSPGSSGEFRCQSLFSCQRASPWPSWNIRVAQNYIRHLIRVWKTLVQTLP